MNAIALVHALGSSGLFAARMFAPALATAGLLRFAPQIPGLASLGLLANHADAPNWFTSDACLVTLMVLTIAELLGDKIPEVRETMATAAHYLKPAMAAATALGVLSATDQAFAAGLVVQAGLGDALPALVAAGGTTAAVVLRGDVLGRLEAVDPGDTFHLRRLVSWAEDGWALVGAVVLVLVPAVMALALALATAILAGLRRRQRQREDAQRRPCGHCQAPMFPKALECGACHAPNPSPCAVGVLGQALATPAGDRHATDLLALLRCPACAARLQMGRVGQACATCGTQPFATRDQGQRFLAGIDARLPHALGVVAVASLVPVLGFLVGAVYGELRLIGPLRVHLPLAQRWLLKWPLRLLRWAVLVVQVVPLLSGVMAAVELVVRYRVYRAVLARRLSQECPANPLHPIAPV